MKCPIDNIDLVMSDRQGIEIDYCPTCRGVWLDRGELDKIIERSGSAIPAQEGRVEQRFNDDRRSDHENYSHDDGYKKKRKKESFLSEIFDF